MEEATKINNMTDEEEPDTLKTQELLSQAQVLMRDIEELLDRCTSRGPSNHRLHSTIEQEGLANVQEDGETVIIAGFRFESAASREDLRRLEEAPDHAVVSVTPAPTRSNDVRGNNGRRRAKR